MSPFTTSLLHSIWQAGLIWLGVTLLLRRISARAIGPRYWLALGAVGLVMMVWFGTWTVLENQATEIRNTALAGVATATSAPMQIPVSLITNEPAAGRAAGWPWQNWILWLWQVGVGMGFGRIAMTMRETIKLGENSAPVEDPRWLAELKQIATTLGARVEIRLQMSRRILSPVVSGIWQPVILLPASYVTGVPVEALRAALAHEVAHVVRWDILLNLLQMGTEALLFFNPFVWALNQIVRQEREACCDALASRLCTSPASYAEALIWWAREATGHASGVMAMAPSREGGKHWLRDRVWRLLRPGHIPKSRAGWLGAIGAACAVGLFFFGLSRGVHFTVTELTAKERVAMIHKLAEPFLQQIGGPSPKGRHRHFSGTIVDEAGKPVAHIRWKMLPADNMIFVDGETGIDGQFSGTVTDGLLRLFIEGTNEFAPTRINREQTASSENIRVQLSRGIDFAVQCLNEKGKPTAGVKVSINYQTVSVIGGPSATSGSDGVAWFHHQPGGELADVSCYATGYQVTRIAPVTLEEKSKPSRITLKKAEPFLLQVVDEKDGTPLSGVSIKTNGQSSTADAGWPEWSGLETDAQGRVALDGLVPGVSYEMEADRPRDAGGMIFTIQAGSETHRTLQLPRERRLKLKIIHLNIPESKITLQYQLKTSENGADARFIDLPIVNGVAETELRGLRPDPVDFYLFGVWAHSPELKAELTEFTIDYDQIKNPPMTKVVFVLDPGRGGAAPTGNLDADWTLPNSHQGGEFVKAPIKDGRAELEFPRTAQVNLRNDEILGGTLDERIQYEVTTATTLTIPVKPAGMIRAKILEKNAALAEAAFARAHKLGEKNSWIEIKSGAYVGDAREWFVSKPITFGWWASYEVVASEGNRFAISPSFRIHAWNPVQDVALTLPEPVERRVHVVDEQGQPAADVTLLVTCFSRELGQVCSDQSARTDRNGLATLILGKDEPIEHMTVRPINSPYIPTETALILANGKPTELTVESGHRVAGRILDKSSGEGVAGIRVRWSVERGNVTTSRPYTITTDKSGRFEFTDAPAERVFMEVEIPYLWDINDRNDLYVTPDGAEATIFLKATQAK